MAVNELAPVAATLPGAEVPAVLEPGDVVFFGGHVLHRSHANRSPDALRRAFVGHYCNARCTCPGTTSRWASATGNGRHLLARGETRLPSGRPRFMASAAAASSLPA